MNGPWGMRRERWSPHRIPFRPRPRPRPPGIRARASWIAVAAGWIFVGVPLAWGILQTVAKAASLFR